MAVAAGCLPKTVAPTGCPPPTHPRTPHPPPLTCAPPPPRPAPTAPQSAPRPPSLHPPLGSLLRNPGVNANTLSPFFNCRQAGQAMGRVREHCSAAVYGYRVKGSGVEGSGSCSTLSGDALLPDKTALPSMFPHSTVQRVPTQCLGACWAALLGTCWAPLAHP